MTPPDPNQTIYCRRLGHPVPLSYCARESVDLPCRLIYQCWEGRIPVRDYLLTLYSASQLEALREPDSKLASLVDLIKRAQESK
ncbi:MAG: hypothetical protein JXQ71_17035 [Verrucomicrobia bacterium]|nr:hypothetical protein [Verrucomicrobiota bacterium]